MNMETPGSTKVEAFRRDVQDGWNHRAFRKEHAERMRKFLATDMKVYTEQSRHTDWGPIFTSGSVRRSNFAY